MDTYSFDVPAQKTRKLRILFTPTDVHVFNANLILTVMPQKTTVYKVRIYTILAFNNFHHHLAGRLVRLWRRCRDHAQPLLSKRHGADRNWH